MWNWVSLTSHIDVGSTPHVSPRKYHKIKNISNDTQAAYNRHYDTVTDARKRSSSWIFKDPLIFR